MKKKIVLLIMATTILSSYIPVQARAETMSIVDVVKENDQKIKYENGIYNVKNKVFKIDEDKNSAARSYVNESSEVKILDDNITSTIEFNKKSIMSNTKVKVNGKIVDLQENHIDSNNVEFTFKLESLKDNIEVSTTINLGFMKMDVSFRFILDTTDIPVIFEEDTDTPTEEKPNNPSEDSQNKPSEDGQDKPSDEEYNPPLEGNPDGLETPPTVTPDHNGGQDSIKSGNYTIENDVLHINKDEESIARTYLDKTSYIEYFENKIYLTLKFSGKSMMSNHSIEVNGENIDFDIISDSEENISIRLEIPSLDSDIVVSTKVLEMMDVKFRVKLNKATLKKADISQDMDNNSNGETSEQLPTPQKPSIDKEDNIVSNSNVTTYKINNEILTDSNIGYNAARAAVNNISYIEEVEGKKYITIGLSQLDTMSNVRVYVNGSAIKYEVVRKNTENNTMDIKFEIPNIKCDITFKAFIDMVNLDISFGLGLLEDTIELISKSEINRPLGTPSKPIVKVEEDDDVDNPKEIVNNEIEVKDYFKKYTIENNILSDSSMGRAMTRKYLDKISILEEIDGKLYLTIKLSGTDAMGNINILVNGEKVEYLITDSDIESKVKLLRFGINDINDEIKVQMLIKVMGMNVEFGIDLLEDTRTLIDEGTIDDYNDNKDSIDNSTLLTNKKEVNIPKVVLVTVIVTGIVIFSIQYVIYKKIRKK